MLPPDQERCSDPGTQLPVFNAPATLVAYNLAFCFLIQFTSSGASGAVRGKKLTLCIKLPGWVSLPNSTVQTQQADFLSKFLIWRMNSKLVEIMSHKKTSKSTADSSSRVKNGKSHKEIPSSVNSNFQLMSFERESQSGSMASQPSAKRSWLCNHRSANTDIPVSLWFYRSHAEAQGQKLTRSLLGGWKLHITALTYWLKQTVTITVSVTAGIPSVTNSSNAGSTETHIQI